MERSRSLTSKPHVVGRSGWQGFSTSDTGTAGRPRLWDMDIFVSHAPLTLALRQRHRHTQQDAVTSTKSRTGCKLQSKFFSNIIVWLGNL